MLLVALPLKSPFQKKEYVAMTLYSYCLRYDTGAAPNPYWGVCTLVICKPAIRRNAVIGDWIVGLGSKESTLGDISEYVVYAMKVTNSMKMSEYDEYCQKNLPNKIPNIDSAKFERRVGDCIYDFRDSIKPRMRPSVHDNGNRKSDLNGVYALLSDYFWYFGNNPVQLPENLKPIIHPSPGHKSKANDSYVFDFIQWIESLPYSINKIHGEPQLKYEIINSKDFCKTCAKRDKSDNEIDNAY